MTDSSIPIRGSVYDYPNWYDVLFSESVRQEVEFLLNVFDKFDISKNSRRSAVSFFEPACGSGRLLWRLAQRGIETIGLDLNPKSVEFCNSRLRRHGLPETACIGDMTSFSLNDLRRRKPFDLAFNLVSSFLHLTSEESARNHLRAMAASLKSKGHYLIGLHLLPQQGEAVCSEERWTATRGKLLLKSQLRRLAFDRRTRIETVEFRIRATTPTKQYELIDCFPLRTYTSVEFRALLESVREFEIVETYDFCLDLDNPIVVDKKTEDVVFVLRKKSGFESA